MPAFSALRSDSKNSPCIERMRGLLLFTFYTPKTDTKGRSKCGFNRIRKAGVSNIYKNEILKKKHGNAPRLRSRAPARGRRSRPSSVVACAICRPSRAALIHSTARASPRKRIDHDFARGLRHRPAICNRSGREIRKRAGSTPPAAPPALGAMPKTGMYSGAIRASTTQNIK